MSSFYGNLFLHLKDFSQVANYMKFQARQAAEDEDPDCIYYSAVTEENAIQNNNTPGKSAPFSVPKKIKFEYDEINKTLVISREEDSV